MKISQVFKSSFIALFIFLAILSWTGPLNARSLHWDRVEVRAHLNADGSLSVTEFQTYIFNGDWNGGERWFNVYAGQRFEFLGIERIENGVLHPLRPGKLNRVDEFKWVESHKLRWRSRLPSDPNFKGTKIQYVLRYRYDNVLRKTEGQYVLDHDFLFSDRSGVVRNYSLIFSADPVWQTPYAMPLQYFEKIIQPGFGFVLKMEFKYMGYSLPHALSPIAPKIRYNLWLWAYALGNLPLVLFFIKEKIKGRFEKIPPYQKVTQAFLDKRVFSLLPEEVGALWDEDVGAAEVMAVIARMVQEKKLKSTLLDKKNMRLDLLVPKSSLKGYEKILIDGLFFDNQKSVDTVALKLHYRKKGFDPANLIGTDLNATLERHSGLVDSPKKFAAYRIAVFLVLAGLLLVAFNALICGITYVQLSLVLGLFSSIVAGLACFLLVIFRKEIGRPWASTFKTWFCVGLPLWIPLLKIDSYRDPLFFGPYVGLLFFVTGLAHFLWVVAQTEDSAKKIALRRELICVRNYLKHQLKQEKPNLKDAWLPYLLAFGLGGSIDHWARAFGAQASGGRSLGVGNVSSGASRGWSGGGGQFGGAGATGAWVAATSSMAAGVAAPSSSSSGGSSGGGGGGGW